MNTVQRVASEVIEASACIHVHVQTFSQLVRSVNSSALHCTCAGKGCTAANKLPCIGQAICCGGSAIDDQKINATKSAW